MDVKWYFIWISLLPMNLSIFSYFYWPLGLFFCDLKKNYIQVLSIDCFSCHSIRNLYVTEMSPYLMLPETTSQDTLYHIFFIFSIVITTTILLVISSLPLSTKYTFQEDKLLFSSIPPLPMMVHNTGETFNNVCWMNKEMNSGQVRIHIVIAWIKIIMINSKIIATIYP